MLTVRMAIRSISRSSATKWQNFCFVTNTISRIENTARIWIPNLFAWSKRGWMPNGPVFKCHLNTGQPKHLKTGQMDAILFSYVLVWYMIYIGTQITRIQIQIITRKLMNFFRYLSKCYSMFASIFASRLNTKPLVPFIIKEYANSLTNTSFLWFIYYST